MPVCRARLSVFRIGHLASGSPSSRMAQGIEDPARALHRRRGGPVGRTSSFSSLVDPVTAKPSSEKQPPSVVTAASDLDGLTYTIREVPAHLEKDALYVAPWKRQAARFWGVTGFIGPCIAAQVGWEQLKGVRAPWRDGSAPHPPSAVSWLFLIVYLCSWMPTVPYILVEACLFFGKWRKRLELTGDAVPRVDIVITCCNERADVVENTVLATLALDYPRAAYRVIIADDGASAVIAAWASDQLANHPNLYYTARLKPAIRDFKGGNLNHSVEFTAALPGGPAPFFAGLDADMIPERRWLRRVLPHLLLDAEMGMACPAQSFFNVPPDDLLGQENRVSFSVNDVCRDMCNAAWNSGSGYVLRRRALEEVGGFPTTVCEDVYGAMLLLAGGWKTSYVPECLQYGLVPESYLGHIKQHIRWTVGGFQMFLGFSGYLSSSRTKHLGPIRRVVGFTFGIGGLYMYSMIMARLVLMPAVLMAGQRPLPPEDVEGLRAQIRLQALSWLCISAYDAHRGMVSDYRSVVGQNCLRVYMAPYYLTALVRSFFLPTWLGGTEPGFTPTGSIDAGLDERSRERRAPLSRRLRSTLLGCGVLVHVMFVSILAGTMAYRVVRVATSTPAEQILGELLAQVGLLFPTWLLTLSALTVPIRYMLAPPDVPDWEELMDEPEMGGGPRYCHMWARQPMRSRWKFGYFEVHCFLIVYHVGLYLYSFRI
ncbi:glycosyltransferase family 2 protein [Xylariaceae sp. FL0804]|nr:glycosyltransferase family 2 protein [Xylariaceae sp. FL0804]